MTPSEIESVVLDALANANRARESSHHLAVAPDAVIFGPGSPLDSLGLVALLMDIEDSLRDRDVDVNLSDARAVSATRSPFRDVPSLVAFIGEIVEPPSQCRVAGRPDQTALPGGSQSEPPRRSGPAA